MHLSVARATARPTINNEKIEMPDRNKVLIVEDDPVQQKVIAAYIEKRCAASCLIAGNGRQAMALLNEQAESIRLITCDLNMPESDGIELLDAIRQINHSVPIVIITSAREFVAKSAEMLARAHGLNFLGVIRKPTRTADLDKVLAPVFAD